MSYLSSQFTLSRWQYNIIYLSLSATALYYLHLGPNGQAIAKNLASFGTNSTTFTYPGHPTTSIRRHYTGIQRVDDFIAIFVAIFLGATFEKHIKIQQANLLLNLVAFVTVSSIEAVRSKKWSAIIFTSIWAAVFQLIGGAIIIPLYIIAHGRAFGASDGARPIPVTWAKTLLPAVISGYLLPTALMFYPFKNIQHTMLATAMFQPSPILVNVVWVVLKLFASKTGNAQTYIRRALVVAGVVATCTHIGTVYACFSSQFPSVTFRSIFLPLQRPSAAFEDLSHFFFQVDYLIIYTAVTIWSLQVRVADRARAGKRGSRMVDALRLGASVAILGPGATLSWVWYGRQGRLGLKNE